MAISLNTYANELAQARAANGAGPPPTAGPNGAPRKAEWPAALRQEAYHGPVGDFVRLVEQHTEADPAAMLVSALIGFGNMVGRNAAIRINGDSHHCNEFGLIVGDTSTGRKGTSWGVVRHFLRKVDMRWADEQVTGGISSGQGVIEHVRDAVYKPVDPDDPDAEPEIDIPAAPDKRLLAIESELSSVLKQMSGKSNIAGAVLRQGWDGTPLASLARKENKLRATDHHISVIAHISQQELNDLLNDVDLYNGFANRFLVVVSRRSRRLPRSVDFDSLSWETVVSDFQAALEFAQIAKPQAGQDRWLTEPAGRHWDQLYNDLEDEVEATEGLAGSAIGRAPAHVTRLAMIYAVLDRSDRIGLEHLHAAEAVWTYCAASARYVFGGVVTTDPLVNRLIPHLQEAARFTDVRPAISRSDIRRTVGTHYPASRIDAARLFMQKRGMIEVKKEPSGPEGGKPTEWWYWTGPGGFLQFPSVSFQETTAEPEAT